MHGGTRKTNIYGKGIKIMIPKLKRLIAYADVVASSHTNIKTESYRLKEGAANLAEAMTRSGHCADAINNRGEVERRYRMLLDSVIIIALVFDLDL